MAGVRIRYGSVRPDWEIARAIRPLWIALLLLLAAVAHAQTFTNNYGIWSYEVTNNTITIQGYGGPGGVVTVPDTINGLPVTSIANLAFFYCTSLTNVVIPDSLASIENDAFDECASLTSVILPSSVTFIGWEAFANCPNLGGVYFKGNAPGSGGWVFLHNPNTIAYYLPGTTGWGATFGGSYGGCPTTPWFLQNPMILNFEPNFGVQTNGFGFTISWATNIPVVVEACTNLANPVWNPVATNTLTGGSSYFCDPQLTNNPGRFYRLRSP